MHQERLNILNYQYKYFLINIKTEMSDNAIFHKITKKRFPVF